MPPENFKPDFPMPKYSEILLYRYSDTTFLLQQITKQYRKFNLSLNCISRHPNMANNSKSRQKRGVMLAIYNFPFDTTISQDVKQLKRNVANLMYNQFIESNP